MISASKQRRTRGFSLIEVLVAVVILSVGLLALASLQLSLIRNSSDTKAQTVAAGLAKARLETLRSYRSLDAYRTLVASTGEAAVTTLADSSGDQGGVDFTRTTTVNRFLYDKANAAFVNLTAVNVAYTTYSDTQLLALNNVDGVTSPQYVPSKDFKRITVGVTWTDALGDSTRRVSMEDVIDSLDPTESAAILTAAATLSGARKLEKKIADPALDAMVIPIAVGGGSESAASNPKPVVTSGHDTIQTHFDIYTYNAVNGGTANVQQVVSTDVVACTCTLASPPASTVRGKRPTYWNGSRYAVPADVDATGTASYSPPASADSATTQSALCTSCCRDHVDPIGVKGAAFSPRLVTKDSDDIITATTHTHYLANALGTAWTAPVANGKFSEACRVILVDGFHRTAADMSNDFYGLLATKDLSNTAYYASSSVPDATATTNYQSFVVDYLDTRFTNNTVSTTYNTSPSTTTMVTTHSLDQPASIALGTGVTGVVSTYNVSAITRANPAVVTTSATHNFANGDRITISGVGGMTALNGNSYIIAGVTITSFQLVGVDSSTFPVYTSGGTAIDNRGKWLHARGLYMDYLEKDAIAAVGTAKTNCSSQSGNVYSDCVLKVLPFTSINLTEIADWATADSSKAAVTTNDFSDSSTRPDPVRGKVTYVGGANASTVVVSSRDRKSNTGLLDLTTNAISAADNAAWDTSPSQTFQISNGVVVPPVTPDTFYAVLTGGGLVVPKTGLAVSYKVGAAASAGCGGYDNTKTVLVGASQVGTYGCKVSPASALPGAMGVEVVNYNTITTTAGTAVPNNTSCTGGYGAQLYNPSTSTPANLTFTLNTCNIFPTPTAVNTTTGVAALSSSVTNPSGQSAKTLFNFALILGDPDTTAGNTSYTDLITVTFGSPVPAAGTFSCTYTCSGSCNSSNTQQTPVFSASSICAP